MKAVQTTVVTGLFCLLAGSAFAQQAARPAAAPAPTAGYALLSTYFSSGFYGKNIRIGKNVTNLAKHHVDEPQSFVCPEGQTCRVEAEIIGQVFKGEAEDNSFSFCGLLDEESLLQGDLAACVKLGFVPKNGKPAAATSIQISNDLPAGVHTVQFVANSDYAATMGNYNAVYRVYAKATSKD